MHVRNAMKQDAALVTVVSLDENVGLPNGPSTAKCKNLVTDEKYNGAANDDNG